MTEGLQGLPLNEDLGPDVPSSTTAEPAAPRARRARATVERKGPRSAMVVRLDGATALALRDRAETLGLRAPADLAATMLEQACADPAATDDSPEAAAPPRTADALLFTLPFLLVSSRPRRLAPVVAWLRGRDDAAHVVGDLDQAQRHVHDRRWACVVVDCDSLGDLRIVVDRLVTLREERPNLPVILMTRHVRRDDFDLERLPLCDATLRYPTEADTFAFAVQEALINNLVWIARRRMLHLSHAEIASWPRWMAG